MSPAERLRPHALAVLATKNVSGNISAKGRVVVMIRQSDPPPRPSAVERGWRGEGGGGWVTDSMLV